jgi:hypothetical protein
MKRVGINKKNSNFRVISQNKRNINQYHHDFFHISICFIQGCWTSNGSSS